MAKKSNEKIINELEEKLKSMEADQKKKLSFAKDQLVEQLSVTADKYCTATGVMEALRVLRAVIDGSNGTEDFKPAFDLAHAMVVETQKMRDKVKKLATSNMDELCDGFYNPNFIAEDHNAYQISFELMRLDLCRNVGPAADDIKSFLEKTDDEIKDVVNELNKAYKESKE